MGERSPAPVDAPDGQSFFIRVYRSGTIERFISEPETPEQGGRLLAPLIMIGWLIHVTVFRGRWIVAVSPGRKTGERPYREAARCKEAAEQRALRLKTAIQQGRWTPERDLPPGK